MAQSIGGFQTIIDSVITKIALNNDDAGITYLISPSMGTEYTHDRLGTQMRIYLLMGLYLLCTIMTLLSLVSRMQVEKTTKMRDFMRMMGMNDTPYYLSHFIFHAIFTFFLSILTATIAKTLLLSNVNYVVLFIQTYLIYLNLFFIALLAK